MIIIAIILFILLVGICCWSGERETQRTPPKAKPQPNSNKTTTYKPVGNVRPRDDDDIIDIVILKEKQEKRIKYYDDVDDDIIDFDDDF